MRSQNREHKPEKVRKHLNRSSSSTAGAVAKNHGKKSTLIPVAEWPLNGQDVIRVRLDQYCGRNVVDLRVWWRAANGEYRPSPRGVTFDVRHLSKLSKAFRKARVKAKKAGLIGKS
jgi:transcriptional coactivator p15 (PC4)